MELVFLTASHVVLSFAFAATAVLTTHQCFGFCQAVLAQHQGCLSRPLLLPKANRVGMGKRLGGDRDRTADPNRPKGYPIPYDVTLSNKSKEKGGGGTGHSKLNICLPKQLL